jgi:SpoIVB peptidase S55
MNQRFALAAMGLALICGAAASAAELQRPKSGPVEIFHLKDVKPGMHATAWTVFTGTEAESVPIEVIGVWKGQMGPRHDVILAKMLGKAKETNVAAGMSGSPVYIDGKLVGAVAFRFSVFSPDAICGITPIELMLEINDFDKSRPADARTPDKAPSQKADVADMPGELLGKLVAAGGAEQFPSRVPVMTPIETPLMLSGFSQGAINAFEPLFHQMGIVAVQGGSSAADLAAKPVKGWESSLNPGEAVSGILVSGDMSATGMGTVTYNDGKRVLAFGHPFFNLGPLDMPMAKSEILMVLSSAFQPTKFGNATEVVGALHQDRYSGIMGELGAEAPSIPVHLKVRSLGASNAVLKEKDFHFNVFVQQKWTPFLMMLTLFNTLQQINEYADEMTYRLSGDVMMDGAQNIRVSTMLAPNEAPAPPPMVLAGWWGDKFSRLFLNSVTTPKLKSVDVSVDLMPERRVATIENAWTPSTEVAAGSEIPVKVFLRPYRGERIEKSVTVKIPAGMTKGDHRILFSDADTLNRMQHAAAAGNRYIDIPETVSLLNQERGNNQLYVSLIEGRPTYYSDDKTLPALPASVLNVLQTERTSSRSLVGSAESAQEQLAVPFDQVVSGSYSLRITVK